MRTVALNHCPIPSDKTRAKLLRHLLGRMLELVEDGLSVDVPADPFDFHAPLVSVSFSGRDNKEMARRLKEEYHILVSCTDGALLLSPAPDVTFEDMDYVQGAVYQMLLEQP